MTTLVEMFDKPNKQKSEPIPTRDTAADALDQAEKDKRRRALYGGGLTTAMLTGPGGVSGELTGTRNARGS